MLESSLKAGRREMADGQGRSLNWDDGGVGVVLLCRRDGNVIEVGGLGGLRGLRAWKGENKVRNFICRLE
jgi:hypothetical protein